jgi:UDP-glucose:glycoprotein glucosyltransferase
MLYHLVLMRVDIQKEPKLARARQIPEWEEYDSEISRFAKKLAEEGVIKSQGAAVDVNVLAGGGPSEAAPSSSSSESPVDESSEVEKEAEKATHDEL